MKSKRDREEPCFICNHYHDVRGCSVRHGQAKALGAQPPEPFFPMHAQYERGEPCQICGHVMTQCERRQLEHTVLPTVVIPGSLYLGSYDTASRSELLKALGITHILNVRRIFAADCWALGARPHRLTEGGHSTGGPGISKRLHMHMYGVR